MKINQQSSKQVYLPSEYELFRQLERQINLINPYERDNLKRNFKQKYQEHMKLLRQHQKEQERVGTNMQKQVMEKEKKLREIKEYIVRKQKNAHHNKLTNLEKRSKDAEGSSKRWEESMQKNHKKYKSGLEKSVQLIRKWEEKGEQSLSKKKQILSQISNKFHTHNQYVHIVAAKSRQLQSQQSQRNFAKLNPEVNSFTPNLKPRYYKHSSEQISKNGSYNHLRSDYSRLESPINSRERSLCQSRSKSREINRKRTEIFQAKKSIEEQQIEKALCKNVEKQSKINDARNYKHYIQMQKNRMNHQLSSKKLEKLEENRKKIEVSERARKKQLDIKFKQDHRRKKDISLPLIRNKVERTELEDQEGGSYIYLTALDHEKEGEIDNSQKYNRAITEKLRSLALIMSRKQKEKKIREAKFFHP